MKKAIGSGILAMAILAGCQSSPAPANPGPTEADGSKVMTPEPAAGEPAKPGVPEPAVGATKPGASAPSPSASTTKPAPSSASNSASGAATKFRKDKSGMTRVVPGGGLKIPRKAMQIADPVTRGWMPDKTAAPVIGERLDKSLRTLENAFADCRITFQTTDGTLIGKPKVKIGAGGRWSIEYLSPESRASTQRIMSNGQVVAQLGDKGWASVDQTPGPIGPAEAGDWPTHFSKLMYSRFLTGRDAFGPLFTAWASDPNLKVTVESRSLRVQGKAQPFYRVLAKGVTKDGPGEMEVILNGVRNLPVTIRTEVVSKKGEKQGLMWTGRWAFGGSFKDDEFKLPKNLKSGG